MDPETLSDPKVLYAKDPPPLGADICSKMEKIGQIPATVVDGFQAAPVKKSLFKRAEKENPHVAVDQFSTIPEMMHLIDKSHGKSNGQRVQAYQEALSELGPVPEYVNGYMRHLIHSGEVDKALDYLQKNPNLYRYISYKVLLEDLEKFKRFFSHDEYLLMRELMGMSGKADES